MVIWTQTLWNVKKSTCHINTFWPFNDVLFYFKILVFVVFFTTVQPQHCIQQTLEMVLPETATTNPSTTQLKRFYNQRSLSAVSYRTFPSKRMEEKKNMHYMHSHGTWVVLGVEINLQMCFYNNAATTTSYPAPAYLMAVHRNKSAQFK